MIIYVDKDPEKKDFKKLNNYVVYKNKAIKKLDYVNKINKINLINYIYSY